MLMFGLLLPEPVYARSPAKEQTRARVKRAPKPRLLLTMDKAETATPSPWILPVLGDALRKAFAGSPLVITDLGLKKPTAARTAWELRRRRLRWFGVTVRLESVSAKVVVRGQQKLLTAEATVSLSGTRKERRRKGSFKVQATGKISLPVSVVLQGEILAGRIAATRAAVAQALKKAVTKLK